MIRISPLFLLASCASTLHTPVDLHLDVAAPPDLDGAFVRLCAEGGQAQQYGATGRGTYVLTGVFADTEPRISVDVLDEQELLIGRAGPTTLLQDYQVTDYQADPCAESEECTPCTGCVLQNVPSVSWDDDMPLCQPGQVPEREQSWTIGVRFAEPAP